MFKLYFILILFFASCSQNTTDIKTNLANETINNTTVYLTNNAPILLAPFIPSLIKDQGLILHKVQGSYQGKTFLLDGILKIDKDSLKLVALTPISRLFSITLNKDGAFFSDSPQKEIKENPQYIIMDLCLIYLSKNDLEKNLPNPYKIVEKNNIRTIFFEKMPIINISYDANNHLISNIKFNNLLRDYSYNMVRIQ